MQQRTCTIDGCDKPHRARGLCASHWNATYRKDQHREVPCTICGTLVVKNAPGRKRRPVCSERCRYRVTHGRWPETGKELVGPVERRRVPPQVKPTTQPAKVRFVATICGWCAAPFLHDMRITGTLSRWCSLPARRQCGGTATGCSTASSPSRELDARRSTNATNGRANSATNPLIRLCRPLIRGQLPSITLSARRGC